MLGETGLQGAVSGYRGAWVHSLGETCDCLNGCFLGEEVLSFDQRDGTFGISRGSLLVNLSLLGGAWEGRGKDDWFSPGSGWLQGQLHWLVTGTVHTHKGPGLVQCPDATVLRVLIIF